MGKLFGILVIVLGVWLGLKVFTEGADTMFGGLFAGPLPQAAEQAPPEAPLERIRTRAEQHRDAGIRRLERGLEHE